jgi:hypothetical protein
MTPTRGRLPTLPVLAPTCRPLPAFQAKPYTVLNHIPAASSGEPAAPFVQGQDHPEGCSKISRGPALHQPGTNVAPTGAHA